jgi:5-formyltetrahydrofolate cyclo-ligase
LKLINKESKSELRRFYRQKIADYPVESREREEADLARQVGELPDFAAARTVAIFLSMPHEVNTAPVIELCRNSGKRVVVPVIVPEVKGMIFVELPIEVGRLTKNFYGIWEPREADRVLVEADDIDLMLAPGHSFTVAGDRLGAGGGYYDRYLERFPEVKAVGLAYSVQRASALPTAEFDRRVGAVIFGTK